MIYTNKDKVQHLNVGDIVQLDKRSKPHKIMASFIGDNGKEYYVGEYRKQGDFFDLYYHKFFSINNNIIYESI